MQIENWNDDLRRAVVRRYAELSKDTSIYWEAAQATTGLPVYCDLGGCLVIDATGRVTIFDLDSKLVRELEDESWLQVACLAAAERYPEFLPIKPRRPSTASNCNVCGGSGRNSQFDIPCAKCMGVGWK